MVLLILGQSNAGNHGATDLAPPDGSGGQLTVFDGQVCRRSADPLPFATGRHQSIWSRLEGELARLGPHREVIAAVLAVDSTHIDDWTRFGSPLRQRLGWLLQRMVASGLQPEQIVWQQGEADARRGTTTEAYVQAFERLRMQVRESKIDAPWRLARSTVCRNDGGAAVRAAQDQLFARHPDLRAGPDTDSLRGAYRVDGCHFSSQGLDEAARLWAAALTTR